MKSQIRKRILNNRKNLSTKEVSIKSHIIYEKLIKTKSYSESNYIMVYMDFRNEVETKEIIKHILKDSKIPVIPISIPATKELLLSKLTDFSHLQPGAYGILEPKKDKISPCDPQLIDLILVPGVAFDKSGYRLGYGAGYYDRFISSLKQPVYTIGLSFDLQIIDKVPIDSHDQKLDCIITETHIYSTKK